MSNDFLDDIKEESYSDALAFGNLLPKHREEIERFTSGGYFAAIHVCLCTGCGTITRSLSNIFHREIGDKGSSKALALQLNMPLSIPLEPSKPITYTGSRVKVCAECVAAYGFSPDIEAQARSVHRDE